MKDFLQKNCFLSTCKKYRWSLDIEISNRNKEIIFIGLNPSLSDNNFLDHTTKKIIKIANYERYGKIKIINIFALISKNPRLLTLNKDPIGYLNNKIINFSFYYWSNTINCDLWLGWGNKGQLFDRDINVLNLLRRYYCFKKIKFSKPNPPLMLKKTKLNHPMHPLYCLDQSKLINFFNIET